MTITVNVKWGRDRIPFELSSPDAKLSALRSAVAKHTQLPEQSFKLVFSGAVMKDDNAPLSAYSIRDGSTITLIGSATPLPNERTSHKHSTNNESERSTVTRIQSELQEVRNSLLLDVDTFLRILDVSRHENPHSAKALEMEHNRLEELLLQTLLRLDAINSEGTWEGARAERKGAVKEVQALLDRLDEGWNQRSK